MAEERRSVGAGHLLRPLPEQLLELHDRFFDPLRLSQYAREKVEILRDLRNYRAAESPSLRMGNQELSGTSTGVPPTDPSDQPRSSSRGL